MNNLPNEYKVQTNKDWDKLQGISKPRLYKIRVWEFLVKLNRNMEDIILLIALFGFVAFLFIFTP